MITTNAILSRGIRTGSPAEVAERLIPAAEWEPRSVDVVPRLPPFAAKMRKCERIFRTPYSELDQAIQGALVLRRLQQVTHTLRLNPAWRERIAAAGVEGAPRDYDEWQALPITDKNAAAELFTGSRPGMVVPLGRNGFEIVASGGTSSGVPSETVYSLRELHDTYRIAGRFMGDYVLREWLAGTEPKWVITTLADYQMWSSGTMVGGVLQHIPGTNYIGAGPVTKEVYQHMMGYPGPKAIMGISASIALLAELGAGMGEEARNSFRVAMYGSGLMTGKSQAALKELYPNVVVMSYFAATQAETIGLQRGPDSYLATVPGLHLVEIVDDQGRWVEEGEEGELVVTRLHAHEAPVLRYRIGDRVIRRPDLDGPGLKTRQFEFVGRSGDVLHLNDTQYSAQPVYQAITRRLRELGIVDLEAAAREVQFVNERRTRRLDLLATVDDVAGLTRAVETMGEAGVRHLFIGALIGGLSLFNKAEANVQSIEKTGYQFRLRFVPRGSAEVHRTEVGKVPLLRDLH